MNKMEKAVASIGLAASLSLVGLSASAEQLFTVDETVGGGAGEVTASRLNGGYTEVITFGATGNPDILSFDTVAYATFSQFFRFTNPNPVSADIGTEYRLYATFESSGFVDISGPPLFSGSTGSFSVYLDDNLDTIGSLPGLGSGSVSLANTADDNLIGTSTNLTVGAGIIITNPVSFGAFDLTFDDFALTAFGETYFIQPNPFYLATVVDGDFNTFNPAAGLTQILNGDVSAVFVSEPGTLALMGLSLMGLAAVRRRFK